MVSLALRIGSSAIALEDKRAKIGLFMAPDERPSFHETKAALGRALFAVARIERIHIIGCGRSGTTMMHLAMACFKNVTLSNSESGVQHPHLRERLGLALRSGTLGGRKHYITKRDSGWTTPGQVDDVIKWTRLENIGILHLVRDPRDVMLSKHVRSKRPDMPYISPERWYESTLAADQILGALSDHPRKLTLRYEDIILQPLASQQRLAAAFGLEPSPDALPIDRVKDNFERLGLQYDGQEITNLNGLRNMDAGTVGQWRKNEVRPSFEAMSPESRDWLERFCEEYGYDKP